MTPTTSTTACAPTCSASTTSPRSAWSATSSARSRRRIRGSTPAHRAHELVRRLITRMIEDVIAETGAARRGARAALGRRRARMRRSRSLRFSPAMAKADADDQGLPLSAHVPPCPRRAHHGRGRGAWCASFSPIMRASRPTCRPNGPTASIRRDEAALCAPHRRLHRRHDRPLRADRARALF